MLKKKTYINMFQKKSSPSFSVKKLRCFFWDGPRFEDKINSDEVREYFETLGLDVWDAWSFFKLLDREPRFFGGYSGREGCCFGIVVKDGHNEK